MAIACQQMCSHVCAGRQDWEPKRSCLIRCKPDSTWHIVRGDVSGAGSWYWRASVAHGDHVTCNVLRCKGTELTREGCVEPLPQEYRPSAAPRTYAKVVEACAKQQTLAQAKRLLVAISENGFDLDGALGNAAVSMFVRCGGYLEAISLFNNVRQPTVSCWTAVISACCKAGKSEEALKLYKRMQEEGVVPSKFTFIVVLKVCGILGDLTNGRLVHAEISRGVYTSDVFVGTALVSMYAKCGSLLEARHVFDTLPDPNVVSWNAMISGYAQGEQGEMALHLYANMLEQGLDPDNWTFSAALRSCGSLAAVEDPVLVDGYSVKVNCLARGRMIHKEALRRGYELDTLVGNTLVDMYAKCGSMVDAQHAFDILPQRDVVSWNTMIAGYTQQQQDEKALQLYTQMKKAGQEQNVATFLWTLKACGNTGALHTCCQIHNEIVKRGLEGSVNVATTLVHSYSKCGSMVNALQVFKSLPKQDVVTWSALIGGYARHGEHEQAVDSFAAMQEAGIQPNEITFTSLLTACSHAGCVGQGIQYFKSMLNHHHMTPTVLHYTILIDLLGRAGHLNGIQELLQNLPLELDLPLWMSLLGASRKHNNVEVGRRAFDNVVSLEPKLSAGYVLMANIYSHHQMWEEVKQIQRLRVSRGAFKEPGRSWIEIAGKVQVFVVGDRSHPQSKRLYAKVQKLNHRVIKEEGT